MAERLTMPEALRVVGRMIRGYPNKAQDAYLGAIAETLLHYPKSIALVCADPFRGVVLQSPEFLPSQSLVIGWCEKRCRLLYEEAAREDRIARQLSDREIWRNQPCSADALAKTRSWLDRSDPAARELIGSTKTEDVRRREILLSNLQEANRKIFEHECKRAGVDPGRGISPALMALITDAKKEDSK